MATLKVLGQSNPSATTATTLYTVPGSTTAVVSSLSVCNLTSTATTFRIAVRINGATLANSQYIYYDVAIPGSDTFFATVGLTLGAGDVLTVYAGNANLTFQAFGQENS